MVESINAGRVFSGLVLVHIIGSVVISLIVSGYGFPYINASIIMNMIKLVFAFWICRRASVSLTGFCRIKRLHFGPSILLFIPIVFFAFTGAQFINSLSMLFFSVHVSSTAVYAGEAFLLSVFATVILPAVCEEIFFRGLILNSTGRTIMDVLFSSVLFALLHMNFNQMAYAFVMGILLAYIVIETDNLTAGILVHALFNMITLLILTFSDHDPVRKMADIRIGNYYLLGSSLRDMSGHIMVQAVCTGALVAAISLAAVLLLIRIYCQMEGSRQGSVQGEDRSDQSVSACESRPLSKRPRLSLVISIAICLIYAVLIELQ